MNILMIGSTSEIAFCVAKVLARRGSTFYLVAKDLDKLKRQSQILEQENGRIGGVKILDFSQDFNFEKDIDPMIKDQTIDMVLIAVGVLPVSDEVDQVDRLFKINTLGVIICLMGLKDRMIRQGRGTIGVITSVAGDRGRASNYLYGATKACLSTYLEGFDAKVFRHGVRVVDIRCGPLRTPMTRHLKAGLLWKNPETIAESLADDLCKKPSFFSSGVIYSPWYWRYIMAVLKVLPRQILRFLKV